MNSQLRTYVRPMSFLYNLDINTGTHLFDLFNDIPMQNTRPKHRSQTSHVSIQYRMVLLMTCYQSNKCHLHYVACIDDHSSTECNRHNDIKAESVSVLMYS